MKHSGSRRSDNRQGSEWDEPAHPVGHTARFVLRENYIMIELNTHERLEKTLGKGLFSCGAIQDGLGGAHD